LDLKPLDVLASLALVGGEEHPSPMSYKPKYFFVGNAKSVTEILPVSFVSHSGLVESVRDFVEIDVLVKIKGKGLKRPA
jgi:hypothetical protein